MSLSQEDFNLLNAHWAVSSIKKEDLGRADDLVNQRLAQKAVGNQIEFSFGPAEGDDTLLERVALAHEMAAVEGLEEISTASGGDDQLRKQAVAASYKAFNIYRTLQVPEETHERMFFVFRLSALAYCGDRWSDLRRWYNENHEALKVPSAAKAPWDFRLLYRLFDCWTRLFRKEGWDDLDRIREIVAGLRNDQKTYEKSCLVNGSENGAHSTALRLVAMYHWAKASETLAHYMLQGEPADIFSQVEKHFEAGIRAAAESGDIQHEIVLRWLHASSRIMVTNSLWWATRTVNSRTTDFVRSLTKRESHRSLFELLPPQRAALLEQGLLDQAKTAIVVELPTSGGKTLLAQFRILQALNQFADRGWVAYVAPTRALSSQITRRLRRDFEPINIKVEQLTAAVEVDAFEEQILTDGKSFDVLVATPEKLSLVIRNKKVERTLALVVMDEAHNLEAEGRGLRIELLLATVKQDCSQANFLLLMPYVDDIEPIARWLAQDINAGRAISLGTTTWKPNERIIGIYRAVKDDDERAGWRLEYETLTATEKAMPLCGNHFVGDVRPIPSVARSKVIDAKGDQKGFTTQTAAMAAVLSGRKSSNATSVAVTNRRDLAWKMARDVVQALPQYETVPDNVRLVQDFLKTEISPDFELVSMLSHGVGVHHAGLSDEVRSLIEWLAESGDIRVLCATSTISQGINFPVSSVFLASHLIPKNRSRPVPMEPREFWNLAGRAGRIDHDTVGVVGIAQGNSREEIVEFVKRNTGELVSRLVTLIDNLAEQGSLDNLSEVFWQDQWEDFRCYIAHLWAEKKNLEAVLSDSENILRQTYGYRCLRRDSRIEKAEALLKATKIYVHELAKMPHGVAELADSTGFSPESVRQAMKDLGNLEKGLSSSDWMPDKLFGDGGKIADLFGVMLNIKQIGQPLEKIAGSGFGNKRISEITLDWVEGKRLGDIAKEYFTQSENQLDTDALTKTCMAIYRAIVNNGTWGLSALRQVSGINFDQMSEQERFKINVLPAMVYHGVRSEDAVLMRMNSAPRSTAEALGTLYRNEFNGDKENRYSVRRAREFLKDLNADGWNSVRPEYAELSGRGYKRIWEILSGETA